MGDRGERHAVAHGEGHDHTGARDLARGARDTAARGRAISGGGSESGRRRAVRRVVVGAQGGRRRRRRDVMPQGAPVVRVCRIVGL